MSESCPRRRLGELGEVFAGGTPSREHTAFWNGSIPWVTPTELAASGKVVYETREKITPYGLAASNARLVPPGSALVATRATLGACALAGVPMATNQGITALVLDQNTLEPHFFSILLTLLRKKFLGYQAVPLSPKFRPRGLPVSLSGVRRYRSSGGSQRSSMR